MRDGTSATESRRGRYQDGTSATESRRGLHQTARHRARVLVACLAAFVCLLFARGALAKFAVPPNTGPVTDTAGVLDAAAKDRLAQKLVAIRAQTSYEVTIFVCPSLEGDTIEDVSYETYNTWKLGQAGKDNGVLLVLAMNDHKSHIEVGKGVEGALTDLESSDILSNVVRPRMRANDVYGALDEGSSAIAHALVTDDPGQRYPAGRGARGSDNDLSHVIYFFVVLVFIILVISRGGRGGRGGPGGFFWFGGGGGDGGGGGGGGDWGGGGGGGGGGGDWGGGGSSGGGGASGDW